MPNAAVEREAYEKAPARGAESRRQNGAPLNEKDASAPVAELAGRPPVGELAAAPRALLHPRLLLGLQGLAGNAAVASLIQESRKAEPAQPGALPPATAGAEPPLIGQTEPEARESDDELAGLDAAAETPGIEAEPSAQGERELVARDAQAELEAGPGPPAGGAPETGPGAAEAGVPIEARPPPEVRNVGAVEPSAGLARVAGLPPAQLLSSLGTVSGAVGRYADQEHKRLTTNPPQRPRHPGAPSTVQTPASSRMPLAEHASATIPRMPEGRDVELPRPDPGLELKPGAAPRLPLEGNADPAAVQQQRGHILMGLGREHTAGQRDAAQPMGEDELFPTAPAETLRATVAAAPGANGQSPGAPLAGDDEEAASIIARPEKGGEIQSAIGSGLTTLAGQRQEYAERTVAERAKSDTEMAQLEEANVEQQTGERAAAKRDVVGLRHQWTGAQQELVASAQRETDTKTSEALATVAQERAAAERQAAAHYEAGQREADQARHEGEQQAAAERKKAQNQNSGGVLGAIGSAAQSLLDKAKQAVQFVIDKASQLVRSAIQRAQQLARAVLEGARKVIAVAIRTAGVALIAIGDRVLVAFPALRARFREAILARVAAAEAAVNKLAGVLKQAVQNALTSLGARLSAAIALWRRGMLAAIDGVRVVVRGALDFARSAIAAFGTFAVLVKDVAANPVRWVSNLAAAARDGIRNHLWPDLKAAVQGWFTEKLDGVLGLGSAVWSLLRRGGITVAHVATFAWEGIKSMIPQMVIWVLIEKLVALIVPAAAAVMLIIQALQAAWGSLGRILQAFDAFIAFLKGVRWGNAGPLFGGALAAAAVAVIEFISQFLLQRLMSAAGVVAGKVRALAKRIGTRLAAAGRGVVRGARWLGGKARKLASGVKGFARRTVARPQVRWHAWRLGRTLDRASPAFKKLGQLKADQTLDPNLKLQFLRAVRSRIGPGVDLRSLMTKVVVDNSDRFSLQGKVLTPSEVASAAPLTKLVSLRSLFEKDMLEPEYKARFANFDEWRVQIERDPSAFNPAVHIKPQAEMGRWWSPFEDANETGLQKAINTRQLGDEYKDGAIRVHISEAEAAKMTFHKPTAFDAMFFDPWQPPPKAGAWGFIAGKDGKVRIRETVTNPVKASSCEHFELLPSEGVAAAAAREPELAEAIEALP